MKIAVIGATGKVGSLVAREARMRGHLVTAVIRPGSAHRLEFEYPVIERDVFELAPADLQDFDAVVDAFGTPFGKPGNEHLHLTVIEYLIKVFEKLPDVRLLVVGGAGSLYENKGNPQLVLEGIAKDFRAVPEFAAKGFEKLKASGINWTYLSPPKNFDAGGVRTGKYMTGSDYVILNSSGESYGSYADYALAMVDEIEFGWKVRKRFTIVSDSPFFSDRKKLFNIAGTPFFRKGGYMGIFSPMMADDSYGQAALYLGSRHGVVLYMPSNKLIDFFPTYNGKRLPYAVKTQATELTVQTRFGNLYFCFAEPSLLLIRGDAGMGIRFRKNMSDDYVKPRGDSGAWEAVFRRVCSAIFKPLQGKLEVDAPWDYDELTTPRVKMDMVPDEGGSILLAIEESEFAGVLREQYPSYEEALEDCGRDWNSFLETIPHFDAQLEERREEFSYVLWSHLVDACGLIKRPLMYMFGTTAASSWQMCQNAVALGRFDLSIPIELLLNTLDGQGPTGQLTDNYDDMRANRQFNKPPLHGWALKLLMKSHDLAKEISRGKLEAMYLGFGKCANWYMEYRDDDHDGIPQYEHGHESGADDPSTFKVFNIMETPDLSSYLALLFEALGDIALMLGRDGEEADDWYGKSKAIIERTIEHFWNGERFIATVSGTHEIVATDSYVYYLPIVLGKRLPQDIIDKLAEDLSVEGDFLTPYGLASERLSSSVDFKLGGKLSLGYIMPPTNILIVTGLMDAGKEDLAKLIARRYCKSTKDMGLSFLTNPLKGPPSFFGGGSWPACAYMILAGICSE
ncbi:MAG: NAD(P)H-binding protein [Clostridiales bacterium]|jgi:putative NADH-flavin reductase|nr:NAD(P)H-binding protein [Clostridiales bacterium]